MARSGVWCWRVAFAFVLCAGCATGGAPRVRANGAAGFSGTLVVPADGDLFERSVDFVDGLSSPSGSTRVLRVFAPTTIQGEKTLGVLYLRTLERDPLIALELTDVAIYRSQGDGWTLIGDTGWGDSANGGIRSVSSDSQGHFAIERLVSGESGDRNDLVGYREVVFEVSAAGVSELSAGPTIRLDADSWPSDWVGGATGPCPLQERKVSENPDGPCALSNSS